MTHKELQAALWAKFNSGQMPIAIHVAYSTYCEAMRADAEFEAEVELGEVRPSYQGVPIYFDEWYAKEPLIKTEPIEK
jgi:hypothetical protein